jgi:hypothetical protein
MKKIPAANKRIVETLKKYSEFNKIPIKRARYAISTCHRMARPYNTQIISELHEQGLIKLNGSHGDIEILV